MTLLKEGRYAEAVSLLNQAPGIREQDPTTYLLLGKAYYADGRMAEALDALNASVELNSDDQAVALSIGHH